VPNPKQIAVFCAKSGFIGKQTKKWGPEGPRQDRWILLRESYHSVFGGGIQHVDHTVRFKPERLGNRFADHAENRLAFLVAHFAATIRIRTQYDFATC